MTKRKTGVAVIESKWAPDSNVSVRGLFDLVSEMATENPHGYHYEMANSEAAIKESIPRIARYRDCKYLCLAMHGNGDGLHLMNGERLSRTELRNVLIRIKTTRGSKLDGVYLSSCIFGTHQLADFIFQQSASVSWIAGYSEEVDWLDSSALDLLFFNHLVWSEASTEAEKIKEVAKRITEVAPGLARELGFGIYVRKQGTGGAKNLLAPIHLVEAA